MAPMVTMLWIAGAVQLAIALANAPLARMLSVRTHMAGVPPILRQLFTVHWLYIVGLLVWFASLCFLFGPDLAGGSPLGRAMSGFLSLFWVTRIVVHVAYYDPELRRAHRLLDAAFLSAVVYLAIVFGVAASGASL
ncbi:MAG TPA: hypothetical protein VE404_10670 [Verrucomicrobiae bacterium]|nr:hypothetical protein [Verrucomicrobiae bacterium]